MINQFSNKIIDEFADEIEIDVFCCIMQIAEKSKKVEKIEEIEIRFANLKFYP